ncbi:MAG TPA: YdcF family protein [Thermomicrobiales bacterium]|nr:YdcF family protein [Thermomicrobiales bacterium]
MHGFQALRAAPSPAPPVVPPAVDPARPTSGSFDADRRPELDPQHPQRSRRGRRPFWSEAWRWLLTAVLFLVVAAVVVVGGLLTAIYWQARVDQARPADAIVVLGTAQWNGRPGPTLQARLDHGLALYRERLAPEIIVTGGRQPGDQFTEAEAGRDYLIAQGVPPDAIRLENAGRDSWESMQGVAAMLRGAPHHSAVLVSDGFHLLRLKLMARDLGLTAWASPVVDSPIRPGGPAEFSYAMREVGAILAHVLRLR